MKFSNLLIAALLASGLAFAQNSATGSTATTTNGPAATSTQANKGTWNQNHPRRAEVNQRVNNQDKRINQEEKSGQISKQKAKRLKANDRAIKQEEKDMAKQNGGHITKQEQKDLNKQLNKNSRKIGK